MKGRADLAQLTLLKIGGFTDRGDQAEEIFQLISRKIFVKIKPRLVLNQQESVGCLEK